MIIIAFEGLDKSGKNTAVENLYQALQSHGYNVEKSEFHRYDTPTGQIIRNFLDGNYKAPQKAIECIMAADKYAQVDWFKELSATTDVLLLDRYKLSQWVYAKANKVDMSFTLTLLEDLPEPDFTFYLDISPEVSMQRKGQHGDNDIYESNFSLLSDVRDAYKWVVELDAGDGHIVELDGTKPVDELHREVLQQTLSLLQAKKVNPS